MNRSLFTFILILFSLLSFSQDNNCKCFNGIFSRDTIKTPVLTIGFSNGVQLSVCGYEIEKLSDSEILIAEFDVFNCETGEPLISFGALQTCTVISKPDTLVIKQMKRLPFGDNWKWELKPVTQQLIYPQEDTTIITSPVCIYRKTNIEQARVDQFFNELEQLKGKGYNDELENLIGKLGVLTLNGNEKARKTLNDFRTYIGYALDGSYSELWNEVIAITNFECDTNK